MNVDSAIEQFLAHRRLRGVASATMGLYARWLTTWRDWRDGRGLPGHLEAIELAELRDFFAYLRDEHVPHGGNTHRPASPQRGLSPATIHSYHRVLSAFWGFCRDEEWLTERQARYFSRGRIPRPKVEQPIRSIYSEEEIERLLGACDSSDPEESYRDRAIILLLLESGMRAAELCSLTDADVELRQRRARIRGKGGKYRWIFWHVSTSRALLHYLECRRGERGGSLFRGLTWKNDGGALTPDALHALLRRRCEQGGVELAGRAPVHTLRHTFAHRAIAQGCAISEVSQLLGHASLETTMRYLREHPDGLQRAHKRMFEPHVE